MSAVHEAKSHEPCWLSSGEGLPASPPRFYESIKRALDLGVACLLLLLLVPLLAVAALAIKLTSRGPVLYRGTVIGRDGVPFTYYKLRSMVVDADDLPHRHFIEEYVAAAAGRHAAPAHGRTSRAGERAGRYAAARAETEPVHKLIDDPRITPVGHVLRKTSLDEVPQMWNVIRGEMSLVGPRPPVPYEHELYTDYHRQRLAVLPGITGLAQVRARSRASFDEMIEIDLEYIRRRSLALDLVVMARTIGVVLTGRGAH
jgi:lipopolysaccharide/colanic/teichoic acid biosynthesis glycosyltransferase